MTHTSDIHSSEGFLHLLQTSRRPSEVAEALTLLLQSFQSFQNIQNSQNIQNFQSSGVSLSPASLCELLRLLVTRTDEAWLEVRKKISFVFTDLVSKGHGDVLADALLFRRLQTTTSHEATASHILFDTIPNNYNNNNNNRESNALDESMKQAKTLKETRELIGKLAESHNKVERCVPAADVFRTLMRVPVLLEMILSPNPLDNITSEVKAPLHSQQKQHQFHDSCIGILCRGVNSETAVLCTETWRSLTTALYTNKGLSASILLYYFNQFVEMLVECLKGKNFVSKLHALELMATLLEDSAFMKARRKYAESPALLCALLPLTNSPSAHIRFLTFDTLKVYIAKGNKPAPIRYILFINRETLAKYVEEYSTEDVAINKRLEMEKQKLLQSLTSLEPLSHEEELLLSVS